MCTCEEPTFINNMPDWTDYTLMICRGFIRQFPEHRESIQSAGQLLFDILDVEQTKVSKSFTVKPNYNEEMDMCE